ncbi:Ail/Lom family outer membrane beta-barrel protein [Salmonella enterica]|nr:Ail/Lom family outer membrane beta-barrel protein [Salmonella enterica]
MNKKQYAVALMLAGGLPAGVAQAEAGQGTFSVGYAQVHAGHFRDFVNRTGQDAGVSFGGYQKPAGLSVKYRYEYTDTLGVMISVTVAGEKYSGSVSHSPDEWRKGTMRTRYVSGMAGPVWQMNQVVSLYALTGFAYTKTSASVGEHRKVSQPDGSMAIRYRSVMDVNDNHTSLAWGTGVQLSPANAVVIDLAYEGSGSGDWRTSAFIVGVGYRF